jgi:hypothetical protein
VPYLHAAGLIENPPTAAQQATLDAAAPLVQERMQLLGEAPGLLGFLFRDEVAYEDDALKGLPANAGGARGIRGSTRAGARARLHRCGGAGRCRRR